MSVTKRSNTLSRVHRDAIKMIGKNGQMDSEDCILLRYGFFIRSGLPYDFVQFLLRSLFSLRTSLYAADCGGKCPMNEASWHGRVHA
jgi:hypothetical protein